MRRFGPELRVVLRGEFDLAGETGFVEFMAGVEEPADPLVLDLGDLEFIDSSGVRAVIEQHRLLAAEDRRLQLRLGNGAARQLCSLLGLEAYFGRRSGPMSRGSTGAVQVRPAGHRASLRPGGPR